MNCRILKIIEQKILNKMYFLVKATLLVEHPKHKKVYLSRNKLCDKFWNKFEMYRLRHHRWPHSKCGGLGKIVGYAAQMTYFKCLKCGEVFEVEGY